MYNYKQKMNQFLLKGPSVLEVEKCIKRSDFEKYQEVILKYCCSLISTLEYKDVESLLKKLDVSMFCNHSDIFNEIIEIYNIKADSQQLIDETKNAIEMINRKNSVISTHFPFGFLSRSSIITEGVKNIECYLQNYGFFLLQDDSPIIESAENRFAKLIQAQQFEVEPSSKIYEMIKSRIPEELLLHYRRQVNNFQSLVKLWYGYDKLDDISMETAIRVQKIRNHSKGIRK